MNIFYLDKDPNKEQQRNTLNDKHVVKMILESNTDVMYYHIEYKIYRNNELTNLSINRKRTTYKHPNSNISRHTLWFKRTN